MDKKSTIVSDIPDRYGLNLYTTDPILKELLAIYLPKEIHAHLLPYLEDLGEKAGGYLDDLALIADKKPPTLSYRTRRGVAKQSIQKHPAYVEMEKLAFSTLGLAAMSHRKGVLGWKEPLPPIVKYTLTFLFVQAEFGLCCPVSMTDSLTNTLIKHGDEALISRYFPNLTTLNFDDLTQGAMFLTEQGAGSDISATITRAYLEEGEWKLEGSKWFCSNPDAGVALILARPDDAPSGLKGIGLFLLPKYLPTGEHNQYQIIQLKDKLGTRSMASGEIELQGATAYLIGDIGQGFQQMADMINMSRLSNGVRSAGLMRRAVSEALYVARHRSAFGKKLVVMPLMQRQLIKLMIPAEQARSMYMQIAICMQKANQGDERAKKLVRILTPLIKFRACRDARKVTGDAMEVRGGSGYIEEWSDPRLVRDSHLGSIWEGTSNIVALDVMRSIKRNETLPFLEDYLRELLRESDIPTESQKLFMTTLDNVITFTNDVKKAETEIDIRQMASVLYAISSAIFFVWEASKMKGNYHRLALAHLLLKHKLLPKNPLQVSLNLKEQEILTKLLAETNLTLDEAMVIMPN